MLFYFLLPFWLTISCIAAQPAAPVAPIATELKAVYLTWGSPDTSSQITINVLTLQKADSVEIIFNEMSEKISRHKELKDTPFHLYTFDFKNLAPKKNYNFQVILNGKPVKAAYKFTTLPNDDTPIEIVSGGDLSPHEDVVSVAKQAVTKNTMALFLGGDLAYEDGNPKRYELWLQLWDLLNQAMISPDGRLLPLVVAIGNHETNKTKTSNPKEKAPFYFLFFEQNEQLTYFTRHFGKHTSLITLDTGHVADHDEQQEKWLKKELKRDVKIPNLLALYHVPLYPSFRPYDDKKSVKGRKAWLPLFDEYQLDVAFENHDHALKRSKMLKNEKIVSKNGTLYVGDGAWAVAPRPAAPDRWYLQMAKVEKHLWRVLASPKKLSFQAINKKGQILDSFTLKNGSVIPYEQ